jgi:hypothetical protein
MKRALIAITISLCVGCATANKGDVSALKPMLEAFHGSMRWKDFGKLPQHLLPERREAFIRAANARNDEKNLVVTDYELEECDLSTQDPTVAVCTSKISWYRLPSATVETQLVATTLKWQNGIWLIDRQSAGPFSEELSIGK